MKTISADEYKQKYGDQSLAQLRASSPQGQQQAKTDGFVSRVKQTIQNSANQINDAIGGQGQYQGKGVLERSTGAVSGGFNALANTAIGIPVQMAGEAIGGTKAAQNFVTKHPGAANTAENVARPLANPINSAGNQLGKSNFFQEAAQGIDQNPNSFAGKVEGGLNVAKNLGDISGNILLADQARSGAKTGSDYIKGKASNLMDKLPSGGSPGGMVKNITNDITPSMDRIVNHQVTQALDLTAGDVKNISLSTGNEVGKYLADENLIRGNKAETVKAIEDHFNQNYQAVRTEIGRVDTTYKPNQIPRYTEALKFLKDQVEGIPGLQKNSVEIENLLNKKADITLNDVQRVKELIDEHTNLYKATGDVKEGIAKQGLDNVRKDIKGFIEQQVEQHTGAKIGDLNNKVSTSKGILKAVEARSTSGLTKSNLKLGDLGIFGVGSSMGGPLVGAAAVFAKKLLESPSVQLKIAKWLDGISDARKAAIAEDLQAGKIPPEFNQFIKTKSGSKGLGGPGAMNKDYSAESKVISDLNKLLPELHNAVNTEGQSINVWAEADAIVQKAATGKVTAKELARAKEIVQSLKMDRAGFETKPIN